MPKTINRRQFVKTTLSATIGFHLATNLGFTKDKSISSTVFYVSNAIGDDNFPGTVAQPFKTIQKAANTVQAGDTVSISAGIYNERVELTTTGTVNAPITFVASEVGVIIDGTGISWNPPGTTNPFNGLFDIFGVQYINILGLKIINSTYAGFFMENCQNMLIQNCQTTNTVSSGIGVWSCSNVTIDGNTVQLACNGGGEECISLVDTSDSEIKNNEVFNNGSGNGQGGVIGGEGIDVKQGSHHVNVHHNHIHHMNNRLGLYIDAYDAFTHDIQVYNNIVHDCSETGIAVASEGGGLLDNVKIYNNIVYNNLYGGIEVGGWITVAGTVQTPIHNIKIINNTCFNNGEGINIDNAYAENIIVRNNICSQNNGWQLAVESTPLEQTTLENNLIDGAFQNAGTQVIMQAPAFVDASTYDFHLSPNSPAINTGTQIDAPVTDFDGNPRNDNSPDIGAFEFADLIFKHGFES